MQFENIDKIIAFTAGAIGGVAKYIMNVHLQIEFFSKLFESAITAGVCGFIGIAGKELYVLAKKHLTAYFKNRKNKKR